MDAAHQQHPAGPHIDQPARGPDTSAPFLRAPEGARTVFSVILVAACAPLAAGAVFFGWRALVVVGLSVASCGLVERLYYRVTRVPAMLGRSHAYLTGLLLGLTLPPFVPWYVPVLASAFAIIVGKAIFGGVGHFLWQPALVGRLAVAVLLPDAINPDQWQLLAQNKIIAGDVMLARKPSNYRQWRDTPAPDDADAFLMTPAQHTLRGLTERQRAWLNNLIHRPGSAPANVAPLPDPKFSALAYTPVGQVPGAKPAALRNLPPIGDFFTGARVGGIGETCAVVIAVAGLYLIYRNYVKWQLPFSFLAAAAGVVAVAPIQLAGAENAVRTVWLPFVAEGHQVGIVYVSYHLLSGELMLAAMFLATEMTSRPVTTGGQVIFGVGCGAIAMLLRLYVDIPIPCYMAVLAMNTLVPTIDAMWRPRVLGRKFLQRLRK